MADTDYAQGDYRVVAERLRPATLDLVAWCDPQSGSIVLDSASGTGNVALACAGRGCRAVALDLEIALLRTLPPPAAGGVPTVVGDVMALPLASDAVDHVLSTFGMVYAPDPARVMSEATRVCRPGGFVALSSWAEDGFQPRARALLAQTEAAAGEYVPEIPPAWTSIESLRRTLSPAGDVEVRRGRLENRFPSAAAWWELASTSAPPVVAARSRLTRSAYVELGERLQALVDECSEHGDGELILGEEYLLARVRVR
ncbi:methyltransferase domain-containing protein [Nocardioides sp. HM23]|uniref:class I SAM-dependent methyltransferase n=1 Tax=Nocardioides bizhenqiangii TaxID=3095076 RepID=UPI002ACA2179|nr:methyltransferase domain-containing protein [Nocardioides sp. HM23]MDZ5622293.1 methyltransferase domain-containing protein [Nocardioides sp. HM23]